MNVHTLGLDARLRFCAELLMESPPADIADIFILPIPSSRDGVTVNGSARTIESVILGCGAGDVVVGYGVPQAARALASENGVMIVDVSFDDGFLEENAYLTAVGTVGRILSEERCAPCGLSIGIIGYGRIGQHLTRILMFLGARVKIFTTKSELRRDLQMLGVSCVPSSRICGGEELSELSILINTAPAALIPPQAAGELAHTRVIDLASGKNLPDSIPHESFPSVPALMYPKSAGAALYNSIMRML